MEKVDAKDQPLESQESHSRSHSRDHCRNYLSSLSPRTSSCAKCVVTTEFSRSKRGVEAMSPSFSERHVDGPALAPCAPPPP